MTMITLVIIIMVALAALAATFVSRIVYNRLTQAGNDRAFLYRVLTFVFSFAIVFVAICALAVFNIRIER